MKRLFALAIAIAAGLVWTGVGQAQGNLISKFEIQKSDGSSVCTGPAAQRVCTVPTGTKEFNIVVDFQNLPANTKVQVELADVAGNKYATSAETRSGNGTLTWKVTGDQLLANLRTLADPDQQGLVSKVQAVPANPTSPQDREALSEAQQIVSAMRKPIQSLQRYGGLLPETYIPLDDADQFLSQALQALSASSPNTAQANTAVSNAAAQIKTALSKFNGQTNIVLADDVPFSSSTRTANIELNGDIAQTLAWTVSSVALPTPTTQPTSRPTATESRPGNVPTRTPTPTPAPTQSNAQPTATTAAQSNTQPTATTAAQSNAQPTATAAAQSNAQPTATTAPAQTDQQPTAAPAAAQVAAARPAGQSGGASVVTAAAPPPQATAIALGGQAAAAAAGGATPTPAAAQKAVGAAPSGATPNATTRPAGGTPAPGAQATATAAKLAGGVDLSRLTPEAGGASRVLGQAERGGFPLLVVGLVVVAAALGGAALWMRRRT
ncbi:MAG: hypothetical protein U0768_13630 [Anaerolineae bacterium]